MPLPPPRIVEHEVKIRGLDPRHEGVRIAQLSDIHVGATTPREHIRAAIAVRHGVTVRDLLLVQAGTIPRTSSGKIGRRACRAAYLDGSLRSGIGSPTAFAGAND